MGPATLLPIIGLALFLHRRLQIDASLGLFFATSITVLILYLGALAGGLAHAAVALSVVGVLLLIREIMLGSRQGIRVIPPVSLVLLVVLSGVFWLRYGHTKLFFFDEYSHWGIYLKEMIARDALWDGNTNAMHARYLPGPSLFQYFFSRGATTAFESTAFLAQFVLFLTPLLLLTHGLRWHQWPWIIGVLALGLLAVTQFSQGLSSLYVDHVLGAWLAGSLLAFVLTCERSSGIQTLHALPITTLVLIKGVGIAFAIAVIAIIAIATLCRARRAAQGWLPSMGIAARLTLLMGTAGAVCSRAWAMNRDAIGARLDVMSSEAMAAGLRGIRDSLNSAVGHETSRRFLDVLQHTRIGNNEWFWRLNEYTYGVNDLFLRSHGLTAVGALTTFAAWWLLLLYGPIRLTNRWLWTLVSGGLLITAVGYVGSLYLTYLFAFAERGPLLPSYTRYVNAVVISMLFVSFAPLLPGFRSNSERAVWTVGRLSITASATLFLTGLLGLYLYERPETRRVALPNPPLELRRRWEPLTTEVSQIIGDSRILVYAPDNQTNDFMAALLKFLLSPARVHVVKTADFWAQDSAVVVNSLAHFDYLWVTAPINAAVPPNGIASMLGLNAEQLVRITVDERGHMTIGPAGPDKRH
jgi:hypothetical protein